MKQTTMIGLQERQDAPQVLNNSAESLNAMSLDTSIINRENSKSDCLLGCGYNTRKSGSLSARYFVLDVDGKPLTPSKASKVRKLLKSHQAVPVWNKFGEMGIRMLVDTRREIPNTVLGVDFGTKFEGYSIIVDNSNNLNVMWLLPDKSQLVRKMEERRDLRRARRFRNCRRRECRSDNRERIGFIAPSQKMIINSRLKALNEFFKYYPIIKVALEDVRFNHYKNSWGKDFTTIEVGKNTIKKFIIDKIGRENYILFEGHETQDIRKGLGLKKSSAKDKQSFDSHCVDSFSIASEISNCKKPNYSILVVDDSYRSIRRRLHYNQPRTGGIRSDYSRGNFNSVRKGVICEWGLIAGGNIRDKSYLLYKINKPILIRNRIQKVIRKVSWLSHHFKIMGSAI